ncbi:MAG TPA: CPBP family intramembrane glutamic endopeptidase [Candidatus Angelobacter sp.]|nr:CPBP family intramembrane glutamic endopeptidase [Candidatus Angelobacter sp.]
MYQESVTAAAPQTAPRANTSTRLGLFISLFSMIIIREVFLPLGANSSVRLTVLKEGCMFAVAGLLLWLVKRGEGLSLHSVGLGTSPLWKSVLWGFIAGAVCFAVVVGLALLTHYGQASSYLDKFPVPVVTLVVLRAGIVEELFYRGFAIDRLQAVGLGRTASIVLPLIIFSVGHWTGGWANIVIALAAGGLLTAFYLWRKDLVSNMIAHFLVDFVANVLPRLAGA